MKLQLRLHNMDCVILIFGVCIISSSWKRCQGKIIFPPTNKIALEGNEVVMECRTNNSGKIIWRKTDDCSTVSATVNIYTGSKFTKNFSQFGINTTSPGQHDLLFTASMTVAGQYVCIEPSGDEACSQLIVLASNSTCVTTEETNFNSTLECRIQFNGHWFPEIEWEEEYSEEKRNESLTISKTAIREISNQSIVSHLTVDRKTFKRKFICITKFKSGGRPTSTTAKNIPDYRCVVFTNELQEITSTSEVTTLHVAEEKNNYTHCEHIYSSEAMIIIYIMATLLFLSLLFNGLQVTRMVYKRTCKDTRNKETDPKTIQDENLPKMQTEFGPAGEYETEVIVGLRNNGQEVVHLSSNEGLSKYVNINTVPKAMLEDETRRPTANTEYLSLEKRERDLQPALYDTLDLNSEYEDYK